MKPLGKTQRDLLRALAARPFPNHGWVWGNYSTSKRLLDSLVKRGFASYVVQSEAGHRADTPGGLVYYHPKVERWSVTPAGLEALKAAGVVPAVRG